MRKQLDDVRLFMFDLNWHTLKAIENATGHPTASVSARLRDLRKSQHGGYIIERKIVDDVFCYRLVQKV